MAPPSSTTQVATPAPAPVAGRPAGHRRAGSPTTAQRRWLIGILGVAGALRLAWALWASGSPPLHWQLSGDQYSYWYYGKELAAGRGYISYISGEATAYYPIGYPALLAGLFWLVQHTPLTDDLVLATSVMQAAMATASVWLVYVIGRQLFGTRVGILAAGLAAVFPNLVYQVATFQLETTFIFLVLVAVAILATADWSQGVPTRGRLLAFGAVLGLSTLVRPFSLPLLVGLAVAALVAGAGWRRAALAVVWPMLVVVAMAVPWTLRNVDAMGSPVVSSTNMGDTLCIDRNLDARGGFRFADHDGCVDPDTPEVERNNGNTRKAIEFVLEHPGREALQIVRRTRIMYADDHDGLLAVETLGDGPFLGDRVRTVLEQAADWYFAGTLVLAVIGLPALVSRRSWGRGENDAARAVRALVLVTVASLVVVPMLLWGNPRFHVPVLPFMALLAAVPLSRLLPGRQPSGRGRFGLTRS
jgi:4-amino-4-deoxy-L-arabinose transferase-like glycosyltransferase